jgi:hypothetical protein
LSTGQLKAVGWVDQSGGFARLHERDTAFALTRGQRSKVLLYRIISFNGMQTQYFQQELIFTMSIYFTAM